MLKNIVGAFALMLFAATSAYANHEGPYIIGEIKEIGVTPACHEKDDMLSVLNMLPNIQALVQQLKRLREAEKCGIFFGSPKILGQIGPDKNDNDGMPWRVVHVEYITPDNVEEQAYLLVWGTETPVLQP